MFRTKAIFIRAQDMASIATRPRSGMSKPQPTWPGNARSTGSTNTCVADSVQREHNLRVPPNGFAMHVRPTCTVSPLPGHLFVANPTPLGADDIANHTSGRTANQGMKRLAITPDGKTLVGIMGESV